MGGRVKSDDRRQQIVAAALELLADTPVDGVTTRKIAKKLGISQPALFRHFRSREQILLAGMAQVRADLGAQAAQLVRELDDPVEQIEGLARGLLAYVARYPGMPRLLHAVPEPGLLRDALRDLVSMQASFVAELVREGQRAGALSPGVVPEHAAMLFVGMIQGVVLHGQLTSRECPLFSDLEPLLRLWLDGIRSHRDAPPQALAERRTEATQSIVSLDVRPLLARGTDPLDAILAALDTVIPSGVLAITAPFRPAPLLALLVKRGHLVADRQLDEKTWAVDVVVGGAPAIDDLSELEPPEPLERVLEASAAMGPGQVFLARVPRFPTLLIPHLKERDLEFTLHDYPDGGALIRVWKPR